MELALISLLVLLALFIAYTVRKGQRRLLEGLRTEMNDSLSSSLQLLATQISGTTSAVNDQLSSITSQLQIQTGHLNQRMDSAARMVGEVMQNLGELSRATGELFEIGKNISGLQEILKAPKLRGGLGEFFLGDLLSQCLPRNHYELQYTFKNGSRVDAVIKLEGGLVPVDSKFPLENFSRTLRADTDEEKKAARRRFASDCRRHIDAIAASYILPGEGTFNFALMYIPAENVYYETIIKDEAAADSSGKSLSGYAFSKRVVPVSPNTFYAYLQTILLGLRGMEVGSRAEEILKALQRLKNDFEKFSSDLEVLGRHINNTRAKYDEVEKKVEGFRYALDGLSTGEGGPAGEKPELT